MYYLMFAYISFVWGSSFILMKFANVSYPPLSLATYRLFGAAAILFICRYFYKKKEFINKKDVFPVFLMALSTIVPFAVQPYLINKYGSAFIGMMVIFVPLLTILVSIPIINRYPVKKEVIGVLGGLAFSWLIVKDGLNRDVTFIDILLAFTIPLSYALGNTYTKPIIRCSEHVDEVWEWAVLNEMSYDKQVEWLKEQEVDTIFGYPGGAVLPIYDAIFG